MCALAKKYKIDVIGIQEHRIVHSDDSILQYEKLPDGYQLVTTSAWRNSMGASIGGVGLLLSPFASKAMVETKKISDRNLQITFCGNPKTTVIVTYSPTNVSDEDEVVDYFNELSETTKSIPAHNFLIIAGDFNSRVGQDNAKFAYHELTNRNGELKLEFAQQHNLLISNTHFQKKASKLWTCELPSGHRAQLDYILVRKKWRNSILNAHAYN